MSSSRRYEAPEDATEKEEDGAEEAIRFEHRRRSSLRRDKDADGYTGFHSIQEADFELRSMRTRRHRVASPSCCHCLLRFFCVLAVVNLVILAVAFFHLPANDRRDAKTSLLCSACVAAAAVTGQVVAVNGTELGVLWAVNGACQLFGKQSYAVCSGMSRQFKGEFFYVFRELSDEPVRVCSALLPACADPRDRTGEGWQIDLPPLPARHRRQKPREAKNAKTKTATRPLRVLHITDIHVDMQYTPGTEAACDSPVCCRPDSVEAGNKAARVKKLESSGFWGTSGKCDMPLHTVRHMLEHINKTHKIDHIMITGDLVNHADWEYSTSSHIDVIRNLSTTVREFFPETPTFWAIGNHEGVPVNGFAPHAVSSTFWPTELYDVFAEINQPWVHNDSDIRLRGAFNVAVVPGLRIISINTGFCIDTNFFLYLNQSDPDSTMTWFAQQLYNAELAGESAHILAHIPPGYDDCLEGWSRNYYRIIQRFAKTVTGQFFGHVHYDYFTVFFDDMNNVSSEAISVLYAAPSASTFDYVNPAYRIYALDPENGFAVLDHETYYANLAETAEERPPEWRLLYSAMAEYNLTDLSPSSWAAAAERLLASPQLQHRFFQLSLRMKHPHCDEACRRDVLCQLRSGHHNDTLYCPAT